MNSFVASIRRKGIIETTLHICRMIFGKARSVLTVFVLNMRGYKLSQDVSLGGGNSFFQSNAHHITIGGNVRFGRHTRLDAGFGGKISVGDDVLIDDATFITAQKHIKIGSHVLISANCFITDFNHTFESKHELIVNQGYETREVVIGNNVWVGTHVLILPGVHIGDGAVIGAGSVVTKNVPAHTVVAGNPAKIIRARK